jgi:hypothetical protein
MSAPHDPVSWARAGAGHRDTDADSMFRPVIGGAIDLEQSDDLPGGARVGLPADRLARLAAADQAVRRVLRLREAGAPAVIVDSAAGAGKTTLVTDAAAHAAGLLHERALVATYTNAQAFDVARRLADRYRRVPVTLFTRARRPLPPTIRTHRGITVVSSPGDLPHHPGVVIANVAKLRESALGPGAFDVAILDEVYQVADYLYAPVAALAAAHLLVGDPGQIAPVITTDMTRWRDDPAGAHVAAPRALLARHPTLPTVALPVTRRLVRDTVHVVRPAFYPDLPFGAVAGAADRRLAFRRLAAHVPLDEALLLLERGASVAAVELPAAPPVSDDAGIAGTIVQIAERLFARGAHVVAQLEDGEITRPLEPDDLAVVCAYREQVSAVQSRLPGCLRARVLVETANRLQGLERRVSLVWHPLAGSIQATPFGTDLGRFCVALTRHSVACLLVFRTGVDNVLERAPAPEPPPLGIDDHPEYGGLRAHRVVLGRLRAMGRIVRLPA